MAFTSTGAEAAAALAFSSSSCFQRMIGWMPGLRFRAFSSSWAGLGWKRNDHEFKKIINPILLFYVVFIWFKEAGSHTDILVETSSAVTGLVKSKCKISFMVWPGSKVICPPKNVNLVLIDLPPCQLEVWTWGIKKKLLTAHQEKFKLPEAHSSPKKIKSNTLSPEKLLTLSAGV